MHYKKLISATLNEPVLINFDQVRSMYVNHDGSLELNFQDGVQVRVKGNFEELAAELENTNTLLLNVAAAIINSINEFGDSTKEA
jgi:hypothetical protein